MTEPAASTRHGAVAVDRASGEAASELRHALEQMVAMRRPHPSSSNGQTFSCSEELVLRLGTTFRPQELPAKYQQGKKKQCFANAAFLALCEWLVYVEGFALLPDFPLPIHHAWCVQRGSVEVIDVTTSNLSEYIGIPFRSEVIEGIWKEGNGSPLLTSRKGKYPLMRMEEEEIRDLIAPL